MEKHLITREIQIDAGHRVPNHASKCKNLHGHRYVIQATCSGPLVRHGSEEGMVMDFGFLKEEMLALIETGADHGLILYSGDSLLEVLCPGEHENAHDLMVSPICGKVLKVPFIPTAENLARYWFDNLVPRIDRRSKGQAELVRLRVYETPNCWADYPATGLYSPST